LINNEDGTLAKEGTYKKIKRRNIYLLFCNRANNKNRNLERKKLKRKNKTVVFCII